MKVQPPPILLPTVPARDIYHIFSILLSAVFVWEQKLYYCLQWFILQSIQENQMPSESFSSLLVYVDYINQAHTK